ncbi:hypothetical protein LP43_1499 [Methylophaga thiooxydans]|uniref:Uncharacterized protein n=1 Tax=Methylophaga thiooxydans TaxID=392484 RepID=A0A0A0BIQ2_9GAMM|nr:hypothetical protein LP43_1499 [Methylophaga thiooxydans]
MNVLSALLVWDSSLAETTVMTGNNKLAIIIFIKNFIMLSC